MKNFSIVRREFRWFIFVVVCFISIFSEPPNLFDLSDAFRPSRVVAEESVEYRTENALSYYSDDERAAANEYQREQCVLDLYYPANKSGFATVVWFHGGGLTGGRRYIPEVLKERGFAVVAVGYRLSPQVEFPGFLEDAAAAVAWTFQNIERYGGDRSRIFVAGGSAGAYLSAMIGTDARWLARRRMERRDLAGLILVSGQMTTHFLVKQLLNVPGEQYQPVIDENAPLYYLSKDLPPILFVLGDRKIEWKARVEENELMFASLKALGHPKVEFVETPGLDHGISGLGRDVPNETVQKILDFVDENRVDDETL